MLVYTLPLLTIHKHVVSNGEKTNDTKINSPTKIEKSN